MLGTIVLPVEGNFALVVHRALASEECWEGATDFYLQLLARGGVVNVPFIKYIIRSLTGTWCLSKICAPMDSS